MMTNKMIKLIVGIFLLMPCLGEDDFLFEDEFNLNNSREDSPSLYWDWLNGPPWLSGVDWGGETFFGSIGFGEYFLNSSFSADDAYNIKIIFDSNETSYCQTYRRDLGYSAAGVGVFLGSIWDMSDPENPRRLNICFVEWDDGTGEHTPNLLWDPDDSGYGHREYLFIMDSDYDGTGTTYSNTNTAIGGDMVYAWWPRLETGSVFLQTNPAELSIGVVTIHPFISYSNDEEIILEWEFDEGGIDHFELLASNTFPPEEILIELDSELRSYAHTNINNNEKFYYQLRGIGSNDEILFYSERIWGKAHPVSSNMSLFGTWNNRSNYGDIWGYADANTGIEYALMCARDEGLSIIDITNEPVEVGFVSSDGNGVDAKDVKVYDTYAVLISEREPAKVIDLSDPANPIVVSTIHFGNSSTDGGAHNCYIDGEYLYAIGHDINGIEIYNLSNPESPTLAGTYDSYYYHDLYVKNGIAYGAAIYGEGIDIIDVSDFSQMELLANFNYEGSGAHNCWTTEDGNYVIVGDEIGDGNWTRIFDIQDLNNITMVSEFIVDAESAVHNSYVKGDLLYIGHYTEGVRIVDLSDPTNPVEIAYYDTYPKNIYGYKGCWSVYPYFESGKIIASDLQSGLFVLQHTPPLGIESSITTETYSLHQNYPNPFNPSTRIEYSISLESFVDLSVFDISGNFVKALVNSNQLTGMHSIQWDGTNEMGNKVPSGIYFIKIKTGDFSESRKMILLK